MPKLSLTDAAAQRLKPIDGQQTDYFDTGYPGLCLRVGPRSRTWFYLAKSSGKLRRYRLGDYPATGVAAARDLWRKAREQVQAGKPPRAAPRHRDAIETVVADWLKRDQEGNASHDEVKRVFERNVLTEWSGRLVTSIDKRDCLELLDGIMDEGRSAKAANLHRLLHRFFRWCAGRDIVQHNPMDNLDRAQIVERTRVLSDQEIASLWRAAKSMGWPFGNIAQLLLLTAARLREIGEVQWAELDAGRACISLAAERSKNGRARVIALSPLAWRILHDGPRIAGCPHVFSTTGKTPVSGWSRMKDQLDREMRTNEPWRHHDIRRTVRTRLSKRDMGVPYDVREAVLGHVKKGLDRVYDQHDYLEEQHAALAKWSDRVLALVA